MSQKKPLTIAKSFAELQKMGDVNDKKIKCNDKIINTMANLFKEAEEASLEGDDEKAYIFYMRFFNILNILQKIPSFHTQQENITSLLGGKAGLNRTFDQLECISKNLRKRYDELNSPAPIETPEPIKEPENLIKTPSTVSCKMLYEQIKNTGYSMLILDCRPSKDFHASKIKYDYILNVPEEILVKGITVSRIASSFTNDEDKKKWSSRLFKQNILLVDQSSCDFVSDSPVWVLKDVLQNWDQDFENKAPVQLLSGGFESFQTFYPTEVTDPRYKPVATIEDQSVFEDIQYPDAIFEASPNISGTSRPTVNRASKAIALQTYAEKEKHFKEILEEHDKIKNKSVEIEQERLQAEKTWMSIQDESIEDHDTSRGQEVLYKIYELESKARDIENQDERFKEHEKNFLGALSKAEAEKLEEQAKRREEEAKEKERQKQLLEAEQKKLAYERQKKMKETASPIQHFVRAEKPKQIQPPKKPNIPDRSVKPLFQEVIIPPKKRDFSPVRGGMGRGLTGLKNLGNTCYMNSIIQCLSNTTALAEYFTEGLYVKHRNGYSMTRCQIAEEVAAVIKALWEGHRMISSKDLKAIVGQYERSFRGCEQQDSHEFLTILMDWLHSDLQAIFNNSTENNLTPADKAWYDYTKHRESIILRLFYGQIKSTVECSQCQKESVTFDTFSNLSLELPEHANRTHVRQCLDMYFNGEEVSGWMCPNCKTTRNAVKKLDISRLPGILVIHLKRFNADHIHGGYRKNQNFIEFPLEALDMRPYLARSEMIKTVNTKTVYHLYAVSNHYGNMESGHYTAFCKSNVYNKWYKFNDQHVTTLDASEVNSSAAYILFYQMSNSSLDR